MSTTELKNEHVTVELEQKPDCVVVMTITASPGTAALVLKKAVKNVSKDVSFPGFRKGRAPDAMVQTKYSGQIQREFHSLFLNESIHEAITLTKLYPWQRDQGMKAEILEASLEKGGRFRIEFECFPTIPVINPAEIVIEPISPQPINDERIEKHIESLRYHHAQWEVVEGRPTQEGDFVEVKLEALTDGVSSRHTTFHLQKGYIEEWLLAFLLNKNVGDSSETIPPKAKEATIQSETPLRFTIEKIRTAKLDDLSETFVKKFGVENIEQFHEKVKEYLNNEEEQRVRGLKHQALQKKMIERYPFEIPHSLKEDEKEKYLEELIKECKESQMSESEIEKIQEKLEAVALDRATVAVRTHYILSRLADEKNLGVTEQEIMQEIVRRSYHDGSFDMELLKNPDKFKPLIANRLRLNKAMDYLAEHAKVSN